MNIETACAVILGDELAHAIITDQGLHWAVIAAMADARTSDDPRALAAINKYNADQAAIRATSPQGGRNE